MGDTGRESSRKEDSRPKMKFLQDLHFKLKLRRKPTRAALISITFPVVLLLALNMLGYILPIDSGENTETSMAVFLTFAVFLLIIKDSLPTTDIPHTLTTDTPHTLTTDNSPYFNNGQLPIIYHLLMYVNTAGFERITVVFQVLVLLQRYKDGDKKKTSDVSRIEVFYLELSKQFARRFK